MDRVQLRAFVEEYEGREHLSYPDSLGIMTIGVGFNLERGDARATIEAMGIDYELLLGQQVQLTDEQIDQLLDEDLDTAEWEAREIFPEFDDIDENRRRVIVDMLFNLGKTRFSGFRNAIQAIKDRNWERAANEMKDSRWYGQVGHRGLRNVNIMRTG